MGSFGISLLGDTGPLIAFTYSHLPIVRSNNTPFRQARGYISEWEIVKVSMGVKNMHGSKGIICWAKFGRALDLFGCL